MRFIFVMIAVVVLATSVFFIGSGIYFGSTAILVETKNVSCKVFDGRYKRAGGGFEMYQGSLICPNGHGGRLYMSQFSKAERLAMRDGHFLECKSKIYQGQWLYGFSTTLRLEPWRETIITNEYPCRLR